MTMEIFMKEDGICIDIMERESGSIEMEEKKLDKGLRDKEDKESLNVMIRMEDLLIERFIRMTKKLIGKKLNRRFKEKSKER